MRRLHWLLITIWLSTTSPGCTQSADPLTAFANGEYRQAVTLWSPRAVQGDTQAQAYLGIHYYLGLGVEQNYRQALKWLTAAAEAGHDSAQRSLGIMYANGHGVEQNFVTAYQWYYAAYRQGNKHAKKFLDALASEWKLSPNQMRLARTQAEQYVVTSVNPKFDS